jgi:YHS domain-containing protein
MKNYFTAFALCTLIAQASSGAMSPVASDHMRVDLRGPDSGHMRVWIENGARKINVDKNGVILKGYDVVAYFNQNEAIKGSPDYQTTYQGAIYYFSSARNLATFKADPSKYVPQYGAFCANGVLKHEFTDSDPTVFFIEKGKLYVCSSPKAKKEFQDTIENEIKAQRNWYQMFD